MPLVLTLHKAGDPADRQRACRTLEGGRLTIGRGPGNGWVLQDPSRHLSKTHCVVEADGTGYRLTDVSSNGVFLNGAQERLPRDRPVAVADGDEFIIGDYLIRVSAVAALTRDVVAASTASAPRGTAPAFTDKDPFGLVTPAAPPPDDAARAWHDDPLGAADDDLFHAPPPQAVDNAVDDVEGTRRISPADLAAGFAELDDLDDLLGDRPAAPPGADPAARLVAAFLAGAGQADLDVSAHDPEAYFRMIGELVRTMTESLHDVLVSRAAIKGEFGIEQTMLRARDNNALKFALGPQDAVASLLQPGRPGYMPPVQAAREAFDDIRLHQLAVMAGVQAALANLLGTFDPAALEARLEKRSMLDNIVPAARRAKLWEAFAATYKDIARDADSDFQSIFGREFNRAYREQMRPP